MKLLEGSLCGRMYSLVVKTLKSDCPSSNPHSAWVQIPTLCKFKSPLYLGSTPTPPGFNSFLCLGSNPHSALEFLDNLGQATSPVWGSASSSVKGDNIHNQFLGFNQGNNAYNVLGSVSQPTWARLPLPLLFFVPQSWSKGQGGVWGQNNVF